MTIRQSPNPIGSPAAGQNGPSSGPNRAPASNDPSAPSSGPQGRPAAAPGLEELLHLADRAERHALGPVEAGLLRRGVTELAQLASVASAKVREVAAQRDAALSDVAESPLRVACGFCGVPAGSKCRSVKGFVPPRTPHTARLHAAARVGEQR